MIRTFPHPIHRPFRVGDPVISAPRRFGRRSYGVITAIWLGCDPADPALSRRTVRVRFGHDTGSVRIDGREIRHAF
jgi:hypothetical protein